jgi:hypothetical protein
MYGPGTGISVIAFPTGIAPLVVGNGGTDTGGSLTGGALTEGLDDPGRPVVGAGVSETAESPEMSKGTWRAHAVSTVPVTAPVATAKNPRRFIAIPPPRRVTAWTPVRVGIARQFARRRAGQLATRGFARFPTAHGSRYV